MTGTAHAAWQTSSAIGAKQIASTITRGVTPRSLISRSIAQGDCAKRPRVATNDHRLIVVGSQTSTRSTLLVRAALQRHTTRRDSRQESPMAEQPTTDRTDDADARGEHDYDTHRPKDAEQPDSSPVHRQPNT